MGLFPWRVYSLGRPKQRYVTKHLAEQGPASARLRDAAGGPAFAVCRDCSGCHVDGTTVVVAVTISGGSHLRILPAVHTPDVMVSAMAFTQAMYLLREGRIPLLSP